MPEENEKQKTEETILSNNVKAENDKNEKQDNLSDKKSDITEDKKEQEKKEEIKYEFKIPEGIDFDKDTISKYESIVKEAKLNPEIAQKILDLEFERIKSYEENMLKVRQEWKDETLKFLGNNAETEIKYAQKVIEKFGDENLVKLLDDTGLGNKKEIVTIFAKIGKAISEDSLSEGKNNISQEKTLEERLYPKKAK